MLALDGGGIRGVITLEVLDELEQQLAQHFDDPNLRLADYFDYIGGTSTGAIIAAALATGEHSAAELLRRYEELGKAVFTKRFLLRRLVSLYRHDPLEAQLRTILGDRRSLGDGELRSLLLIVLHNTKTDSVWPLSNNTGAKYNSVARCLLDESDRNLDLPLAGLVRASTAAPIYFQPEAIRIGAGEMVFQDGGITPFNNPALLMYLMATTPEYRLGWRSGADDLLVVSVGTGASAAEHPDLTAGKVNALFNAKNLPSVFMNGASAGQDIMCRAIGRCRFGLPIDRELGTMVGERHDAAFTYVRYEADLGERALEELGITSRKIRERVRKLDATSEIAELRTIGRTTAASVDLADFDGFLQKPD